MILVLAILCFLQSDAVTANDLAMCFFMRNVPLQSYVVILRLFV